jgi:hypothetical protein
MKKIHRSGFIRSAATLTVFSFLLSACLMGEEEAESGVEIATDNQVSGSVGDGPIVGATMRILRNDGVELSQLESDANATYNITIRTKGKYYPLGVDARNGTDIVTNTAPDFDLLGAVLEPGKKSVANVNPFSTFAVELARDLSGGVSKTNLETAQDIVSSELNNGLTSLKVSGPMRTEIDGGNIAEIVRASEALGETVRRTRDALRATGLSTSGNNVVRAIGSDLSDSVIDGRGGSRADARTAAVWNIVSAQVMLETMANELHVNGADATNLMANAINQVSVGTADPTLADLTVTAEMITHARIGVVAAHAVTSDTSIADLLTDMSGIQSGSGSSTVRNFALPSDYSSRLDSAILLAAGGSNAVVTTVNDISRDGTQTIADTGGENRAPNISGTPAGFVDIGATYSFTPTASDPDNDPFSFTVSGLPSWASFDNATGQLSGTPTAAGVHTGIVISVTDGALSTSLPAFSITVEDPAVILGSVTLNWTAPTQNEDGTALTDLDGYKIYWGTTPGSYPNSVTINDETVTTWVVDNLAPGTYEFVATSFNTSGVESRYSAPATKVVP